MHPSDPRYPAVQELTAYWLAHPHASDTLEGICRWWLVDGSHAQAQNDAALAWLVENGIVRVNRAGDGRLHYRLAEARGSGEC
jgi:hypothetical protein